MVCPWYLVFIPGGLMLQVLSRPTGTLSERGISLNICPWDLNMTSGVLFKLKRCVYRVALERRILLGMCPWDLVFIPGGLMLQVLSRPTSTLSERGISLNFLPWDLHVTYGKCSSH